MNIDIDDFKILRKVSRGSEAAFRKLYDKYKNKVYNTALSYTQNAQDAEEITQDVFVAIFNNANKFLGQSKVSTWIYRITVNKALNQEKKSKRLPKTDCFEVDTMQIEFNHPGILLENQENAKLLFSAIDSLGELQKTVFILAYVEGLPRQEVAEIMNSTLKSIESLLQRAKASLRKKLIAMYTEGNS